MSFETAETEEMMTSLHVNVYHPQAAVFNLLKFDEKQKYRVEELIRFGRDSKVCNFPLLERRASRMQFAIQAFRHNDSSELCFEIKNMSLRTQLFVNNAVLDHLNRIDLPRKCILKFGEFQLYLDKVDGEAREHFEIIFKLSLVPFCQEAGAETLRLAVAESGISVNANNPVGLYPFQTAVETDENEA